jgi:hypothetical protein
MTHKADCPALDPYAYLLGDLGSCNCGGDDNDVLRLRERYFVETLRSGFERTTSFAGYDEARKFAEAEAAQIGAPVHIWVQRAIVVQPPAIPPVPEYLERVA